MISKIPIYDINTFEHYKNQGIFMDRFGYYAKSHQHLHSVHQHSFYHLVYFTKGTGIQKIDFKKFNIKPGIIYFMNPGQVHSWDFETEPDGYIINFSKDYFKPFLLNDAFLYNFPFFNGNPDKQVIEIDKATDQKIREIFEEILKEGLNGENFVDNLVRILLIKLFICIARTQVKFEEFQIKTYSNTLFKNFQILIEANFTTLKFPKQYAEQMYITANHLNALCNNLINKSAGKLIRERIILEAKRLLINRDLTISEIADQLNFKDQSYFIKFFKKYEETTPDKFRKINT